MYYVIKLINVLQLSTTSLEEKLKITDNVKFEEDNKI